MPKFCPTCGNQLQFENAEICPNCGVRISKPPNSIGANYAGFWIRFGAQLIDGVILLIINLVIAFCIGIFIGLNYASSYYRDQAVASALVLYYIIYIIISWIYFAAQESSSKQATFGKQAMGLIVTDTEGNRLSFGRATGRWLAKILAALILGIGLIMIGFTERKQGLHDLIVSTYVIYR